jgi:hypothetical protein
MSTFGREADRAAEQKRRWERSLVQYEISLRDAVVFSIGVLKDQSLDDKLARVTALNALLVGEKGVAS